MLYLVVHACMSTPTFINSFTNDLLFPLKKKTIKEKINKIHFALNIIFKEKTKKVIDLNKTKQKKPIDHSHTLFQRLE